jgi:hypothetical protein
MLFSPRARYRREWSGEVLILSPGPIPTVDVYLRARLDGLAEGAVRRVDTGGDAPASAAAGEGAFVIIVRHASAAWLKALLRERSRWSGVAYLMDDDIPAAWRCGDVPLDYGLWTTGRYLRVRHLLAALCDRLWLSTPALRARYAAWPARVVEPRTFGAARQAAPAGTRRWAYHGTRIHHRELRWLVPVVEAVQSSLPEAEFEVFGNAAVARRFAHVPRVRVLAPRPWPAYLAHCAQSELAVGLAPLLPGRFNAVRSWVKMLDIVRCGAVGVFSDREPYASALAASGAALLPDDQGRWAAEIRRLLEDDAMRMTRYRQASAWVHDTKRGGDIEMLIRASVTGD